MENPLISVIMPVYNGEKYIRKSIHSVFGQTYQNLELIIINDGSTDQSAVVLQKLEQEAPDHVKLRVIDQSNRGICIARNRGIQESKGEFLSFIDQDDFMKEDCIEKLYGEMAGQDTDIVIGGFDLVDDDQRILEEWELDPGSPWSKYRITAPWGRLFKTKIIRQNKIEFMVTKISEDFYFNMVYLSYCRKFTVIPYRGYCWLYNETSESHANMSRLSEDRNPLVMLTKLQEDMKRPNHMEEDCVEYMMLKHLVWYLFYVVKGTKRQEFHQVYLDCFHWLEKYYPVYKKNRLVSFARPEGESFKIRFIVKVAVILKKCHLLYPALRIYSKT